MKRYHVFSWWLHTEQLGNSIGNAYSGSFETLDEAKQDAMTLREGDYTENLFCDIFETQVDGTLVWIISGEQRHDGSWVFIDVATDAT